MSSSPAWRTAPRFFSLGAIGTLSGAVHGAAASGMVNIAVGPLCGAAVAGGANVVSGPVRGSEAAGLFNVAAGPVHGAQIAGVANVATEPVSGAQVAGIGNFAPGGSRGAQIAGAANITSGALAGAQVSGALNFAAGAKGAQIGALNVAAGAVHGVQIGVVNIAESSDFSLGLLNILYKGRLNLDLWALPEAGLLFAGVKNGGAHYHYIYGVGVRATDTHPVWLSLGLGAHITPGGDAFVDIDVFHHAELAFVSANRNDLYQARVVAGYRFLPELAAFAGPTLNVVNAWNNAPSGVAPSYRTHIGDTKNNHFDGWPGVALGVEGL
jgi:hypothetical protein